LSIPSTQTIFSGTSTRKKENSMPLPLLRTPVDVPAPAHPISHRALVACIGSCFAENIGDRLAELKFPCDVNPFGVLYNPLSIANSIKRLIDAHPYSEDDLECADDRWFSYDHHGRFSHRDRDVCLRNINERLISSADSLKRATHLFITFGTARLFVLKESERVVANCHKRPESLFDHILLTPEQIANSYIPLIAALRTLNPDLEIIFTVSPIRHWKDGASGNQLSKSTLIVAVHQLQERCADVGYFPAYEIVMDELRDYRFYAEDMLHIAPAGTAYIWDRFVEKYVDEESRQLTAEIAKLLAAAGHRPSDPSAESYQLFLERVLQQIADLETRHSFLDLSAERELFISRKIS
jgi:hypothetical protein